MKRLSKSASDITNCKKKSYSTSPEEEAKEFDHASQSASRRVVEDGGDEGELLSIELL